MKLFYFDTDSEHRQLWPQLSPDFKAIPQNYSSPADREKRIDDFFNQKLAQYTGPEPVLLVFHINELRLSGEPFVITQKMHKAWPSELIFGLLITGGETAVAQELIQNESLPETHFQAYPTSLGDFERKWSVPQIAAWKTFLFELSQHKNAFWPLLDSKLYTQTLLKKNFEALLNARPETSNASIQAILRAQLQAVGLAAEWETCALLLRSDPSHSEVAKKELTQLFFGDDQGVHKGLLSLLLEKFKSTGER
jgi:hypothetical protein